jgi:hypothetical protein
MSCLTYICYAGFCALAQNTILPSLAISTLCLLGYVSSTSSASTMPEYWFAFFVYIDTLPLWAICLLGYSASWAILPLGPLCLLGHFASWATLPLGLCIDTLPLRLCLIDIVCFDNVGILICLLGCAITGHLLVCNMTRYVNMINRDNLLDRIW